MTHRFHAQIVNDDDEIISQCSTYLSAIAPDGSCESVELELFPMLRAYRRMVEKKKLADLADDNVKTYG